MTPMLHASFHCGAVRLEIARAPKTLTACNCSICSRYAALWAYYTRKAVRVISKRGALEDYRWNDRDIAFQRCTTCGCVTHYSDLRDRSEAGRIAVNARMMEPSAIASVRVRQFDGAKMVRRVDRSR